MCCILACRDKKPTLEILRKVNNANSHGAGIMWFENGTTKYRKDLSVIDLYEQTEKLELPFVIHFRYTSSGGKSSFLCHPFEVVENSPLHLRGESKRLLMHNGTFADWKVCLAAAGLDEPKNEVISDSRALAMIVAKNGDKLLKKINGYFVVSNADTEEFVMYDKFLEEDGILFSNMIWKNKKTAATYYNHHNYTIINSSNNDKTKPKNDTAPSDDDTEVQNYYLQVMGNGMEITVDINNEKRQFFLDAKSPKNKTKKRWKKFCKSHGITDISFKDGIWSKFKTLMAQRKNQSLALLPPVPITKIVMPVEPTKIESETNPT